MNLRFTHHGRHCLLQLMVRIKLIKIFVATEKKYKRRRKKSTCGEVCILRGVSRERKMGLEGEGDKENSGLHLKKKGKQLERRGTSHKSAVTTGWLRAAMKLRGL